MDTIFVAKAEYGLFYHDSLEGLWGFIGNSKPHAEPPGEVQHNRRYADGWTRRGEKSRNEGKQAFVGGEGHYGDSEAA